MWRFTVLLKNNNCMCSSDPRGAAIQYHHKAWFDRSSSNDLIVERGPSPPTKEVQQAAQMVVDMRRYRSHKMSESSDYGQDFNRQVVQHPDIH